MEGIAIIKPQLLLFRGIRSNKAGSACPFARKYLKAKELDSVRWAHDIADQREC
jgi:hypothetical protein